MSTKRPQLRLLASALVLLAPAIALADAQLQEIQVSGSGEKPKAALTMDATGLPAAVTVIGREEIERTNVGRDYTDLLRRVPGVNAYSFGQGDIGSPIKMRGFVGTSSHGGDVAVYIDGVPQNFPSANQGGPGMSDLSWLTPDMIERIEVIKGPFSALYGDQNRAGAINIVTRNSGDSSVGAALGSYETRRGTVVHSAEHDKLRSFVVADLYGTGGYRDNSGVVRGNLFAKASMEVDEAIWALRGSYYKSDWNGPGYISYANLMNGTVKPSDRDPNAPPLWGNAERFGAVATRTPAKGEEGLHLTAYAEHYDKSRANPVSGNTLAFNVQNDNRWVIGGRALWNMKLSPRASVAVGAELRNDRGTGINQRWDAATSPGTTYSNNWGLKLLTYGVFAQGQYLLRDDLKLIGGLRADAFDYDIDNRKLPAASMHYYKTVTTPRVGMVWSPIKALDLFANVGQGFRSPAERELSPSPGTGALGAAGGTINTDMKPPKVKAYDFGANATLGRHWKLGVARYHTLNQNEIRETASGSGIFQAVGDTTRDGWEVEATWFATDATSFYGSAGRVKGRINNPLTAGQDLISGLPENTYRLGVEHTTAMAGGKVMVNGDAFYISGAPYYSGTNTTPLFSRPYTRYDLRVSYEEGKLKYTAYGTFQPRDYASEQAGATVDTRPRNDLGIAINYKY